MSGKRWCEDVFHHLSFSYIFEYFSCSRRKFLNVFLSLVTSFLAKIMLVFFLMAGMAWVANVSTIFLFQQTKYMGRRTKSVLSYDMDLNGEESISYPVSLTGL